MDLPISEVFADAGYWIALISKKTNFIHRPK